MATAAGAEIRALVERWATAVHAGELDDVLADHAEDIVMFDVPPPARTSPTRSPCCAAASRRSGSRPPERRLRLTLGYARRAAAGWSPARLNR